MTGPITIDDVQRLRLEPDDILVVRIERELTSEQATMIGEALKEKLPNQRTLVIHGGVTVEVIEGATA